MHDWLNNTFIKYSLIGCVGFAVDASVLALAISGGLSKILARLVSIGVALFITWWLHRNYTFRVRTSPSFHELCRYLTSNAVGALVNYSLYCALILFFIPDMLWLALAISSIAALAINYLGARFFVFQRKNLLNQSSHK